MLDEEFLNGLLGKEDVSAEDKAKAIIAEYNADIIGLKNKRDELLGSEKKLKEQISAYEAGKSETDKKIAGLEEELKKATSEDHKKYYDEQLKLLTDKHTAELQKVTDERDFYRKSHLKSLRDKAIETGVKDLTFMDGLKDGFIARVLSMNDFEPKEIDGEIKFLDKGNHTIEDAINAFALSAEGKAYIKNASNGGGARGSGSVANSGAKTMTRAQYDSMAKENPQYVHDFFAKGGKIAD